jgi:hypothetical protein
MTGRSDPLGRLVFGTAAGWINLGPDQPGDGEVDVEFEVPSPRILANPLSAVRSDPAQP